MVALSRKQALSPVLVHASVAAPGDTTVKTYGWRLVDLVTRRADMANQVAQYLCEMLEIPLSAGLWVNVDAARYLLQVAVAAAERAVAAARAVPVAERAAAERAGVKAALAGLGIKCENYILVTCVQQANCKPQTVFCLLYTVASISRPSIPYCAGNKSLSYFAGNKSLLGTGSDKLRGANLVIGAEKCDSDICWLTPDEAEQIALSTHPKGERNFGDVWPLTMCATAEHIVRIWHRYAIPECEKMYIDADGAKNAVTQEGHAKANDLQASLSPREWAELHRRYIQEIDWTKILDKDTVVFVFAWELPERICWADRLVISADPNRVALHQQVDKNTSACQLPPIRGCVGAHRLVGDPERQFLTAAVQQQMAWNRCETNPVADCIVLATGMLTGIVPKTRLPQQRLREAPQKRLRETWADPDIDGMVNNFLSGW
jgi:hypothetical protein